MPLGLLHDVFQKSCSALNYSLSICDGHALHSLPISINTRANAFESRLPKPVAAHSCSFETNRFPYAEYRPHPSTWELFPVFSSKMLHPFLATFGGV
jgi:hypothetical protein